MIFALIMAAVVGLALTVPTVVLVLRGIRTQEWPVLRRRRVIYRGFVVR
ncbi:hypothetical protein ACIBG8_47860 [Nonomuraea sp. NPDC050556]